MENFHFYSPTYFAFGKGKESQVGALVKRFGGSKVLLHYGGGSVKRNGVFDNVTKSLREAQIPYIELGGVLDTIADAEYINKRLLALCLGVWDTIKNSGEFDADCFELEFIGFLGAKRESRRMKGDYVLTANDIMQGKVFDLRVARRLALGARWRVVEIAGVGTCDILCEWRDVRICQRYATTHRGELHYGCGCRHRSALLYGFGRALLYG